MATDHAKSELEKIMKKIKACAGCAGVSLLRSRSAVYYFLPQSTAGHAKIMASAAPSADLHACDPIPPTARFLPITALERALSFVRHGAIFICMNIHHLI